jgi:hypothetical protein
MIDSRDAVGGVLLLAGGIAIAWYSATQYNIGTPGRMGPGMFPLALGWLLAILGAALAVPAFFRSGAAFKVRLVTPLLVLAGIAAFALLLEPFGLIAAILGVVVISSLAEMKVRPVSLLALCCFLCLLAWLIFSVALGINFTMLDWPF